MTISIIEKWRKQIDEEKEYTRSELAKMLTEVFKEIRENSKGEKKTRMKVYSKGGDGGEEKKKRKPTVYNQFVRDTMLAVKEENPEMSRQDLMREIGRMWKVQKDEDVERVNKSPTPPKRKSPSYTHKPLVYHSPKSPTSPKRTLPPSTHKSLAYYHSPKSLTPPKRTTIPKSPNSPKSPKSPKSIKKMIDKNYPELNSKEKQTLLDNLLKTSIHWKM